MGRNNQEVGHLVVQVRISLYMCAIITWIALHTFLQRESFMEDAEKFLESHLLWSCYIYICIFPHKKNELPSSPTYSSSRLWSLEFFNVLIYRRQKLQEFVKRKMFNQATRKQAKLEKRSMLGHLLSRFGLSLSFSFSFVVFLCLMLFCKSFMV